MHGELLVDAEFHEITDVGGLTLPLIRKTHMKKMLCQELSPIDQTPYGEPYEYFSFVDGVQRWTMDGMFRHEMRSLMAEIGMNLKEDSKLEDIGTLEDRKKQYAEFEAQEEQKKEEARLKREQIQRENEEKAAQAALKKAEEDEARLKEAEELTNKEEE